MFETVISKILVAIVCAVCLIKGIREIYHYTNYTIPQQLAELVKQAHLEQPFQTLWDIEVSDEMRDALRLPFSVQQISNLLQMKDDIASKFVKCYVLSHKLKGKELSGVVCVSIDIDSYSGQCNYHFSDVKLKIVVINTNNYARIDNKWSVSSVEIL